MPEVRTLPSTGITRLQQYYDPLRLLSGPPCLPRRWVVPDHNRSPPITRIALPACCAHYPGGSVRVRVSGFLPRSVLPSLLPRRVGIRIATFEACSGFTRVTARWLAQPPKAAFVTRLQPVQSPKQAARQLLDQTGYYRDGIFLHWQHAPTGRTGQRRIASSAPSTITLRAFAHHVARHRHHASSRRHETTRWAKARRRRRGWTGKRTRL